MQVATLTLLSEHGRRPGPPAAALRLSGRAPDPAAASVVGRESQICGRAARGRRAQGQ